MPKNINTRGLVSWLERQQKLGVPSAPMCGNVDEPVPTHAMAPCETLIDGRHGLNEKLGGAHNAQIVLGRDRSGGIADGAGGQGHTGCGMIDLVVGRGALESAAKGTPLNEDDVVNPNFCTDAARIYITQRTEGGIDQYFGIDSEKTHNSHAKSAIGIKADHIRVIGRESIRLFCGPVTSFSGLGEGGETNSNGGPLKKPKIELIADNEKNLQPAVLGNELKKYLEELEKEVGEIRSGLKTLNTQLGQINGTIAAITGGGPFADFTKENINGIFDSVIATLNSRLRKINNMDDLNIMDGHDSFLSKSVFIS